MSSIDFFQHDEDSASPFGEHTAYLYSCLKNQQQPLAVHQAYSELVASFVPFGERLSAYVSRHFGIEDDVRLVRQILRAQSEKKGLGISSSNLSQWFSGTRREVSLSKRTVFKLCLAMDLDTQTARKFVYDCLYQNWFNHRVLEELVYCFFLGKQCLFGDSAFACSQRFLQDFEELDSNMGDDAPLYADATGYTFMLERGMEALLDSSYTDSKSALGALSDYLQKCLPLLHGIRRSGISTYMLYFKQGGVGIKPLRDMYYDQTAMTLPETSYLDMSDVGVDYKRKRLLWGAVNRSKWISKNGGEWDLLNESEIKLEHHAVDKMIRTGILRGNMIALLFFHFCFEHAEELRARRLKSSDFTMAEGVDGSDSVLFEKFYKFVNTTLESECGMDPFHPRRPFDRLFLLSIAQYRTEDPVEYLNELLLRYYAL